MPTSPTAAPQVLEPLRGRVRLLGTVLAALFALAAGAILIETMGAPPRLLGPYLERRSMGHHALLETLGRAANRLLIHVDRGSLLPRMVLPNWKGAGSAHHVASGNPRDARAITVASEEALNRAIESALPGDVITLVPGIYRFTGRALAVARAGLPTAPITVRAPDLGKVALEFSMTEGFNVLAPHWIFENLSIRGTCDSHDACEHAFHVVAAATDVVIRNNLLQDFNAHIKINGQNGRYPDRGRIIRNTLINSSPRMTDAPVTPIDLVAADDWRIEDNLIADFVKQGGDLTSYGAFAKGAGRGTRFERNVVLCEHRLRGSAGRRVGLSFGGGGSGSQACRDQRCEHEHADGQMINNLIASCSDEGIYVNRAPRTRIEFNTLIDTAGISVRFAQSTARLSGNWLDGRILSRDGGQVIDSDNRAAFLPLSYLGIHPMHGRYANVGELDLRWRQEPPRLRDAVAVPVADLCGVPRPPRPAYGALESIEACLRRSEPAR